MNDYCLHDRSTDRCIRKRSGVYSVKEIAYVSGGTGKGGDDKRQFRNG